MGRKYSSLIYHNLWCFLLTIIACCYRLLEFIKCVLLCCMIRLHCILNVLCLFTAWASLREIIRSVCAGVLVVQKVCKLRTPGMPFIVCLLNLSNLIVICRLARLFALVTRVLDIALSWTLNHASKGSLGAEVSLHSC